MKKRSVLFLVLFCALFLGETKGEMSSASFLLDDDPSIALFYNQGDYKKAIFQSRKSENKGNLSGSLNEATILKDLYEYDKAARVLEDLPQDFKNSPESLLLLGRIYYLSGRDKEAVEVLKKFLRNERTPEEKAFARVNLGLSYERVGDDPNAAKSFKDALALCPDDFLSHVRLGSLYKKKGKTREAIAEFEAAKRIDSSDQSVLKELAGLLEKEKRFKEALFLYQKISLSDSEDKFSKKRIDEITRDLGRSYASEEKEKIEAEKKRGPIFVTAPDLPVSVKIIRIGLAQGEKNIEFSSSADFILKKSSGQVLGNGHGNKSYLASAQTGRTLFLKDSSEPPLTTATIYDGIVIEPVTDEATVTVYGLEKAKNEYWAKKENRTYRGKIKIRVNKNGLTVINIISLEEYLYGVVPSEMPSSWPKEALKAQGIAARSEAFFKMGRHKNEGFDLCDEVHCQAYRGVGQENKLVNQYIDETQGVVMTLQGNPIDALYSSACGGYAQDNIFGEREDISYLKGSSDYLKSQDRSFPLSPYSLDQWLRFADSEILCNLPGALPRGQFRWVRVYSLEKINHMISQLADVGNVKEIIVQKREKSGHISSLKIIGEKSSVVLDKELVIRKAFGNLRSSLFKLEVKKTKDGLPEEFIFFGGGWGHGVGMCQSGAYSLAKKGKSFSEILSRYFKGARLQKFY